MCNHTNHINTKHKNSASRAGGLAIAIGFCLPVCMYVAVFWCFFLKLVFPHSLKRC